MINTNYTKKSELLINIFIIFSTDLLKIIKIFFSKTNGLIYFCFLFSFLTLNKLQDKCKGFVVLLNPFHSFFFFQEKAIAMSLTSHNVQFWNNLGQYGGYDPQDQGRQGTMLLFLVDAQTSQTSSSINPTSNDVTVLG